MNTALLEIGTWLRDETMPVEDVATKAYARMGDGDKVTRRMWSEISVKIREADWPEFSAMSGMMWQELVAAERYERFKELLCKKITDFWRAWLEQMERDQNSGNIT